MRATWLRTTALALVLGLAAPAARAEEPDAQAEPAPEDDRPGRVASRMWWWYGIRETDADRHLSGDEDGGRRRTAREALLWVPRVVLFIPQTVLVVATQPARAVLVLEDRYKLVERARRFFLNDAETFGIYPTLFFETGFGANVGLRLFHRDLLGRGEQLGIRAGFGGVDRQVYEASFDTGRRFAPFELRTDAGYEVTNRHRFYTLGNVDQIDSDDAPAGLDAREADVAVRTRYVEEALWASVGAVATVAPRFEVSLDTWLRRRVFEDEDEPADDPPWITDVYAQGTLVGFEEQSDLYTEARISFVDTRSTVLLARGDFPTRGGRVDLWGGYQLGLDEPYRFGRAGGDAQAWIHLFGGNRILRLRLRVASVVGDDDAIPFADYPALGGWLLLRGYARERFRDRIAAVSTVEYRFPLVYQSSAYVFVDAGRVYRRAADLGFDAMRVGYGGGLIVFSRRSFLGALQIASSIDRGVYVNLNVETTDALGPTH